MSGGQRSSFVSSRNKVLAPALETAFFLCAALAIGSLLGHTNRLIDISPHPFWIPVLLVSAYYGTNGGLVAATLAMAALRVGNLPVHTFGESPAAWLLATTLLPVLWYITAIILGEMRNSLLAERDEITQQLIQTRLQAETIVQTNDDLLAVKERLERLLAGQRRTVRTALEGLRALDRNDPQLVIDNAPYFVRSLVAAGKLSVYKIVNGDLTVSSTYGWERSDSFVRSFSKDSALFHAVMREGRFLSVVNPSDEVILGGQGCLAGPILSGNPRMPIAMLKVERIDFKELNLNTAQNFYLACEWIGRFLAHASSNDLLPSIAETDAALAPYGTPSPDGQRIRLNGDAQQSELAAHPPISPTGLANGGIFHDGNFAEAIDD